MIYIKKVQLSPAKVTIASDKSSNILTVTGEDDIGAVAEAFGFSWSPEELREPLEAALEVVTEALKDGTKVEDPGYFTSLESKIKPYVA